MIHPTKIEVKDEPLELELWDSSEVVPCPTQQDGSGDEQMGVEREGAEQNGVINGPGNTFHVTGNGGESIVAAVGILLFDFSEAKHFPQS